MAKSSGNQVLAEDLQISFDNLAVKMKGHEAIYKDFCKKTGLPVLNERLQYPAFNRSVSQRVTQAAKRYNMSAQTNTQKALYKKEPIFHTTAEFKEITEYAHSKSVNIHKIQSFTGNTDILKEQIDVIYSLSKEYSYPKSVTIMLKDMSVEDYALTTNSGNIQFNNKLLRSRSLTNKSLKEDNKLASSNIKGIAAHEMGHVLQQHFGNNYGNLGLEIAKEAYYNINKAQLKPHELDTLVSEYCTDYFEEDGYRELIPEFFGKHYTNPNKYTAEFIKLLKERWGV